LPAGDEVDVFPFHIECLYTFIPTVKPCHVVICYAARKLPLEIIRPLATCDHT
jgi:hypothetical protein